MTTVEASKLMRSHEHIEIHGIETNNLKNIDVVLKKRSVNLVVGPSGSGKSSLAFDTIGGIGQHEMTSMFADEVGEPAYRVRSYRNMIAAVPIPQSNNNNNIRSTIGTYFGINRNVSLLYAALLRLHEDFFVLNKEQNVCPQCRGLGVFLQLDPNRAINYDTPLEACPIKCWTRNRDFYSQILRLYCVDKRIDFKKTFRMLNDTEKRTILFGESKEKYSIKYRRAGIYSRRSTHYYGLMSGKPMLRKFAPARQFFADHLCQSCKGRKFSPEHEKFKLHGLSIGEFMSTPFSDLNTWIEAVSGDASVSNLSFAASHISRFVRTTVKMDLGHLSFHRSVPTLSGGEMQRLRLVQVFNTQLTDLLIVMDEPLAGLSGAERSAVYENIVRLANRHTLVIVDHHDTFCKKASVIIALGEGGGKNGGRIIDAQKYFDAQGTVLGCTPSKPAALLPVKLSGHVYGFKGVDIQLGKNCLNVISGKSGVGKSVLLREYLPLAFERYEYISQKALVGKKNSSVATVLDIFDHIINGYAKISGKPKRFFSKLPGCEGACPYCSGIGYVDVGSEYRLQAQIECRECAGTGFNKMLRKFTVFNMSIVDIWLMTVDEAKAFYDGGDKKISKVLSDASEIMLGYLKIGQPTSTLSGGENIRVKLLKAAFSTASVFGIDEPFKGLGQTEIFNVIQFLNKFLKRNKTIIVAEHEEKSFRYFAKHVRLADEGGKLVSEAQNS